MIKDKSCLFKDIIEAVSSTSRGLGDVYKRQNIYLEFGDEKLIEDDDWCIYTVEEKLEPDTECYVFDYPDYDDETGEEILPEYAVKHQMKCVTTCEALQDVIANSLSQRSDLTVEQLIDAVNYYFDKIAFMEF